MIKNAVKCQVFEWSLASIQGRVILIHAFPVAQYVVFLFVFLPPAAVSLILAAPAQPFSSHTQPLVTKI